MTGLVGMIVLAYLLVLALAVAAWSAVSMRRAPSEPESTGGPVNRQRGERRESGRRTHEARDADRSRSGRRDAARRDSGRHAPRWEERRKELLAADDVAESSAPGARAVESHDAYRGARARRASAREEDPGIERENAPAAVTPYATVRAVQVQERLFPDRGLDPLPRPESIRVSDSRRARDAQGEGPRETGSDEQTERDDPFDRFLRANKDFER